MEIIDLVHELKAARLRQADTKQRLLDVTRRYDLGRSKAYLAAVRVKTAHYQAQHQAGVRAADLREELDRADMQHYRAWVECTHLVNLISAVRGCPDPVLAEDFAHNKPSP